MTPVIPEKIDWKAMTSAFFKTKPYPYQEEIFKAAFNRKNRRITIRAATRAGKSYCLGMTAILKAVLSDNHRVGIIAPTYPKTKIIMSYVADLLAENDMFDQIVMVEAAGLTKLERLRKEVSKQRITFLNGSSIEIKSVDLASKGFGVTGFAYDTTIVDETDEIDDESYAKIYRMLLESDDSQIIEIGNPWKLGHFYHHHHDDDWVKIHIPASACVAAGRMTAEAVEDQRKNLTSLEAQVLLDAEFPDEIEMAVFTKEAIAKCAEKAQSEQYEKILIGVDVARGGRDRTVITVGGVLGKQIHYLQHQEMDTRDIMGVAGAAALTSETMEERYGKGKVRISVDCVGNGAGVHDRLKELGYRVKEFMAGNKATDIRYYNIKTEAAFRLNEMMKAGNLKNVPESSKYMLQLRAWTYEVRSDRQLKIVDPEEKSPDYADSLLIMAFLEIYYGMTEVRVPLRGL